jgi:hypothetical protein
MSVEDGSFISSEQQPLSSEQARIANNHGIYDALVARGLLTGDMPSTDGYGNYWGVLADLPIDHGMSGDADAPLSPIVEALYEGIADGTLAKRSVETRQAFNFRLFPPLRQVILRHAMNITGVVQDATTAEPVAYRVNVADGYHYSVWVRADFVTFPEDTNTA